jgi:hypothetical protein
MTNQEISMQLAIAIGHKPAWVHAHGTNSVWVYTGAVNRPFNYRDPAVIWPIAERYDCFPYRFSKEWATWDSTNIADAPAKAVALAVIKGMKK